MASARKNLRYFPLLLLLAWEAWAITPTEVDPEIRAERQRPVEPGRLAARAWQQPRVHFLEPARRQSSPGSSEQCVVPSGFDNSIISMSEQDTGLRRIAAATRLVVPDAPCGCPDFHGGGRAVTCGSVAALGPPPDGSAAVSFSTQGGCTAMMSYRPAAAVTSG